MRQATFHFDQLVKQDAISGTKNTLDFMLYWKVHHYPWSKWHDQCSNCFTLGVEGGGHALPCPPPPPHTHKQGCRKGWKFGGARSTLAGQICPLVEIGLTVWPNIGGGGYSPPSPHLATALHASAIPDHWAWLLLSFTISIMPNEQQWLLWECSNWKYHKINYDFDLPIKSKDLDWWVDQNMFFVFHKSVYPNSETSQ